MNPPRSVVRVFTCAWLAGLLGGCSEDGAAPPATSPTGDGGPADGGAEASDAAVEPAPDGLDAADVTDAGDASCMEGDAGPVKTVDASAPLTVFDVGAADLRLDLSADGRVALLEDLATGDAYLYDTQTGALRFAAHIEGDPGTVSATSLSGDGLRMGALHGATDVVGGVFDACARAWSDLPNPASHGCAGPPNVESGVFGLNADGTIAVGNGWKECASLPTVWRETQGSFAPTVLALLGVAGGSARATSVSDDGSLIGGFAQLATVDRSPAIWTGDGTGTLLDPSGLAVGEVLVVSADGKMAAGTWNTADDAGVPDNAGFSWTEAEGVVRVAPLPAPKLLDRVWIDAIAADNRLLLGAAGDPGWAFDLDGSEEFAIAWTKASGTRKLQDLVAAQAIAIPPGIHLTAVTAASADGTVVLGVATDVDDPALAQHTFVLRMPVAAYGL